jgi:proteasome lid subunit RPN8/RPN11
VRRQLFLLRLQPVEPDARPVHERVLVLPRMRHDRARRRLPLLRNREAHPLNFEFSPRARRGIREIVRKTRRSNLEHAAELCDVAGRLDLGPIRRGSESTHEAPKGTCKRGRSIGWLHSHPASLPLATNDLSVGDATLLLLAHADSEYRPGVACVTHPRYADVRCYRVKHPIRREERAEMLLRNRSTGNVRLADVPEVRARLEPIAIR